MWEWLTKKQRIAALEQQTIDLQTRLDDVRTELAGLSESVRRMEANDVEQNRRQDADRDQVSEQRGLLEQLSRTIGEQRAAIDRLEQERAPIGDVRQLRIELDDQITAFTRLEQHVSFHVIETDKRSTALLERIERHKSL